jgi:hypothetical protein
MYRRVTHEPATRHISTSNPSPDVTNTPSLLALYTQHRAVSNMIHTKATSIRQGMCVLSGIIESSIENGNYAAI